MRMGNVPPPIAELPRYITATAAKRESVKTVHTAWSFLIVNLLNSITPRDSTAASLDSASKTGSDTTLMPTLYDSPNIPDVLSDAIGQILQRPNLRKRDHVDEGSKAEGVGGLQLMPIDFPLDLGFTVYTYV